MVNECSLKEGKRMSWLLDGRQRRNALEEIRKNPLQLYEWAKSYLSFKVNSTEKELKYAFDSRAAHYLQRDESDEDTPAASDDDNDALTADADLIPAEDDADEENLENSFNTQRQKQGLYTLLGMINMVHPISRGKVPTHH